MSAAVMAKLRCQLLRCILFWPPPHHEAASPAPAWKYRKLARLLSRLHFSQDRLTEWLLPQALEDLPPFPHGWPPVRPSRFQVSYLRQEQTSLLFLFPEWKAAWR